jgi:2-polyprenyl-3-methyl-5-hydroxy-6-metoxy-1,4-benzoquinol methylase
MGSEMTSANADRAGEEYWSRLWTQFDLPRPINPRDLSVRNHVRLQFDGYFRKHLVRPADRGRTLVEVGCAGSAWVSYFAKEHGLRVAGLDYSAVGCEQSRVLLARDGVNGEIIHGNLFDAPDSGLRRFDFVVSFGVVEHFEDTAGTLLALRRLLKPGGRMYTLIPNQIGWMGAVQRRLDRRVFDMHVLLDEPALRAAHVMAGLDVIDRGYFLSTNFGVLNHSTFAPGSTAARVRAAVRAAFVGVSACAWLVEHTVGLDLPATRALSPYIHCVATNPASVSP